MGLFSKKPKHPLAGLTARKLKEGTTIPLVNVEPGFVDYVRGAKPKQPRLGHEAPIALVKAGNRVLAYYDDALVGEMDPDCVPWYADEFDALARRNQFGATSVFIKPAGAKSPHCVCLNWGVGAFGGGIL
jgi:hypothetical protein